jgi:HAD superfamily hydrolase (TIGR01484 family)
VGNMVALLRPLQEADLKGVKLVATDIDGTLTCDRLFTPELFVCIERLHAARIPLLLVTGRSAGWISALSNYLNVAGAIGENGGIFIDNRGRQEILASIDDRPVHRQKLADVFWELQYRFPHLKESADNQFRITDWTFDIHSVNLAELKTIVKFCDEWNFDFTYSNVQGHIKPRYTSKAKGILHVLNAQFPKISSHEIITIGDSPNDTEMFDPHFFSHSIGVANIADYQTQLRYLPRYVTRGLEVDGFHETICRLINTANRDS